MKISIIIPVYKVESYLRRCLESVINQTYRDIEIIIIDDGSPDNCGDICDQYAEVDRRFTVIHQENKGLSEARNAGMEIMTGEYVYFLDADDFISPESISVLSERAEATNADIIIGNFCIINENNEVRAMKNFDKARINQYEIKTTKEKFRYFFGEKYGKNAWNRLYKCDFVKVLKVKFEKNDIIYPEDVLFNLKLYINNPQIELVNEYTYYYFLRTDSIINSYKSNLTGRFLEHLISFYDYAKEQDKIDENLDLIAYRAFSSIDGSGQNAYIYSKRKLTSLKNELIYYSSSEIVNKAIWDLAKGKYIKEVTPISWKLHIWLFSLLYSLNLFNLSALLQMFRFRVYPKNEMKA